MGKRRRWTVIASGFLAGALALVVTFTTRTALVSPVAVAVVAAVGVMALMLQLRLRYPHKPGQVHAPSWLNLAGGLLALAAFSRSWLHMSVAAAEVVTLLAIMCFGISGALVLHNLRKRRTADQSGS